MSKRSKPLPQWVARGFEIALRSIPAEVLLDGSRAQEAVQRYRLRPDNHLTAAFSDLLQELHPCIDSDKLQEADVEHALMQIKAELASGDFQ